MIIDDVCVCYMNILVTLIEHSEDNVITQSGVFENEIEPGVLQSSVQKTCFARRPVAQSKCI